MSTRGKIGDAYVALSQVMLVQKANGATDKQIAEAIALAAFEAGVPRWQINEAYERLAL